MYTLMSSLIHKVVHSFYRYFTILFHIHLSYDRYLIFKNLWLMLLPTNRSANLPLLSCSKLKNIRVMCLENATTRKKLCKKNEPYQRLKWKDVQTHAKQVDLISLFPFPRNTKQAKEQTDKRIRAIKILCFSSLKFQTLSKWKLITRSSTKSSKYNPDHNMVHHWSTFQWKYLPTSVCHSHQQAQMLNGMPVKDLH
jgi:hypothetical protein